MSGTWSWVFQLVLWRRIRFWSRATFRYIGDLVQVNSEKEWLIVVWDEGAKEKEKERGVLPTTQPWISQWVWWKWVRFCSGWHVCLNEREAKVDYHEGVKHRTREKGSEWEKERGRDEGREGERFYLELNFGHLKEFDEDDVTDLIQVILKKERLTVTWGEVKRGSTSEHSHEFREVGRLSAHAGTWLCYPSYWLGEGSVEFFRTFHKTFVCVGVWHIRIKNK